MKYTQCSKSEDEFLLYPKLYDFEAGRPIEPMGAAMVRVKYFMPEDAHPELRERLVRVVSEVVECYLAYLEEKGAVGEKAPIGTFPEQPRPVDIAEMLNNSVTDPQTLELLQLLLAGSVSKKGES